MTATASTLRKAEKLFEHLLAKQPIDYLAELSPDQRAYYEKWFCDFAKANSGTPEALYEALLNYTKWTPAAWLKMPVIVANMTIEEAAEQWRNVL